MKTVILVSGKMQSGKNCFADLLKAELEEHGLSVKFDLFANDLKFGAKEDFDNLSKFLNKTIDELKERLDSETVDKCEDLFSKIYVDSDDKWFEDKNDFTRILLQTYGTDIFRNRVNTDHWVDQVAKRSLYSDADVVIITDTRFENEIYRMKWWMDETSVIKTVRIERDVDKNYLYEHPSEVSLDHFKEWDFLVKNDGSVDDLKLKAVQFITEQLKV